MRTQHNAAQAMFPVGPCGATAAGSDGFAGSGRAAAAAVTVRAGLPAAHSVPANDRIGA